MIEKVEDRYNLYKNRFYKEEFKGLTEEELKKLLKIMHRKEFSRSSMVRFYKLERMDVR